MITPETVIAMSLRAPVVMDQLGEALTWPRPTRAWRLVVNEARGHRVRMQPWPSEIQN